MAVRFRTWQILTTLLVVLAFVVVTLLATFAGVQASLQRWQTDHGIEFDEFLSDRLQRLIPSEGEVDPALIADYLTPYLDPTLYAVVFDADDVLIYWTWKGDHWYLRPRSDAPDASMREEQALARLIGDEIRRVPGLVSPTSDGQGLAAQFRNAGVLKEVAAEGGRLGSFVAGSNGFTVNRTNRRLLEELIRGAAIGLGAAVAIAILVISALSQRVGGSIRAITTSMSRIAAGNRTESPPPCPIAELNEISASASALQKKLRHEEQLRSQWTMDVAHDLRTPIANLKAQAEALADGVLEPTPKRFKGLIFHTDRLTQLSEDLLLLTRVESPDYRRSTSRVRLRDIGARLETAFDARAKLESRALTIEAEDATIEADEPLLERALGNLVENALRHGRGEIHCSLTSAVLCVRNDGSIAADAISNVFDRLYRAAPDRSADGHGLGLSIVKAVADVHGWIARIRSENNQVFVTISLNVGTRGNRTG